MNLEFGSTKRFFDFIGSLSDIDVVALISHTDLDGIVAAKVVNAVLDANVVMFVNYEELTLGLVARLKEQGVTKVVFTDLYIGNKEFLAELERFAHVLILDHHLASHDWNSAKTVFIKGEDGYCAGYLCYKLFSGVQDLTSMDWLVACSCVSDYCHVKPADWLTRVYERYGDVFEQQGRYVRMSGPLWDMQDSLSLSIIYYKDDIGGLNNVFNTIGKSFGDIGNLRKCALEVKLEVERLVSLFEQEKQSFAEGYLFEFVPQFPCGSMVGTIISGKYPDKTILTFREDAAAGLYHVSARRQDKQKNMCDFLKGLVAGLEDSDAGGHVPAAGGHFRIQDLGIVKKRLQLKG